MGAITNVILNTILDVVFGLWLGVAGIALSSSVASTIVVTFFAVRLARADPAFRLRPIGRVLALAIVASIVPAGIVAVIAWSGAVSGGLLVELAALAVFGVVGLGAFLGISAVVGLEEPVVLARSVWGLTKRGRSAPRAA